jgi:hypothetical protein
MNTVITKIKSYLWFVLLPVAIITILSISCIKDIEHGYTRFRFGRDITLYLRKSTDLLTYLGAAYTTTGDKNFLNQFNDHLKEREKYFNEEVFTSKLLTQDETKEFRKGLDISNDLAKDVENAAFEKTDNKAFFSEKYLGYKKRIYDNNQTFKTLINDSSETIIKDELTLLNIYLYTLSFIILGLIVLIKHEIKPVIKSVTKTKRKSNRKK